MPPRGVKKGTKRARQYEHIKRSERESGVSERRAEEIAARTVLSPADLQAANVNFVQGDPYGGSLALDQNFVWRPLGAAPGHRTFVDGVWHIGASTHPGPGLGAGSGTIVADAILEPPATRRLAAKLTGFARRG